MPEQFRNEYQPDVVSHPGETLLEILEDRGMTQAELAERMGRPKKTINELVSGRIELTPETALQLERVLGIPASFWGNLDRNYRDSLARRREREQLEAHLDWPASFPLKQMVELQWIKKADDGADRVRSLLAFFGVSSIAQWELRYKSELAAFRLAKTYSSDTYALTAWLRQGERCAHAIECQPFDLPAFRQALNSVRSLTAEEEPDEFIPSLTTAMAACGVAVVLVPELRGARVCGATRWLGPLKAVIQLSLRYRSNDQLWFTFFHEAAHIVLHGKKEVFVEVLGARSGAARLEAEADEWAAERLIPRDELDELLEERPLSTNRIKQFAREVGVAPGIVVGRLQHDKHVPYSYFNDLKVRYHWAGESD